MGGTAFLTSIRKREKLMYKYIIKRILTLIPIIIVVSFLVFFLMSLTGDAAYSIAGENMTKEEVAALREKMGLNDNIFVRYARYMNNLLHGDLGTGIYGKNVWEEFKTRFPNTLVLALAAMIVTVVVAIPLGIVAALKQNTWLDAGLSTVAVAGISVPSFWLGLMMIILFSVKLGWLPTSGNDQGIKSIIMPAIAAGISNASLVMRMTRSAMLDNLRADFLRTARAKGVDERKVVLKHAMKNALIPIITIIGSQFSILIGGTVVVEQVFSWPGVGNLIIQGVRGNDYIMVTGCVVMVTVFVALVLLAVDILYAYVDPRIKARYSGK